LGNSTLHLIISDIGRIFLSNSVIYKVNTKMLLFSRSRCTRRWRFPIFSCFLMENNTWWLTLVPESLF